MRSFTFSLLTSALLLLTYSCQKENANSEAAFAIPDEVINKISQMGFNPDGIVAVEEGYRIERDIIITHDMLESTPEVHRVPNAEQYSTNNLVNAGGGRVITVYIPVAGSSGGGGNGKGNGKKGDGGGGDVFSETYASALDEAISRFNAQNLLISFVRINENNADIVFTRLSKGDERRGVLGSAGFPTSSGDPYGEIKMSGILESTYGLSLNGIATIMAHEIGHCIGFRHTDYFDRSISCGGPATNEGDGGVGANHIPGTPTGADLQGAGSWMLSCTDGSNRPFTNADKTALDYLY